MLRVRSGQIVFSQGDPADSVYCIQNGQIKITVVSQREEAVIAVLDPKQFFGEGCLAGQPLRMATATALTDSSVVRIEKAAMVRFLHEEPSFSELFMKHLLSRNIRIEEDLVDQLFNSSEQRLARILLLLAHFGKEGNTEAVIPKVSQKRLRKW